MQKVSQPNQNYLKRPPTKNPRFQLLPQTNEKIGLGLIWAGIGLICCVVASKTYQKFLKGKGDDE